MGMGMAGQAPPGVLVGLKRFRMIINYSLNFFAADLGAAIPKHMDLLHT